MKKLPKYKDNEIVLEWSRGSHACALDRIEAFETASGFPIGCVWYRYNGAENQIIEILQSFVSVRCRRRGVRTRIHNQMLAWFPKVLRITTPMAAGQEARGFLKSAGFKIEPVLGYVLNLPHGKRKTKIKSAKSRPAHRSDRKRAASAAKRVSQRKTVPRA